MNAGSPVKKRHVARVVAIPEATASINNAMWKMLPMADGPAVYWKEFEQAKQRLEAALAACATALTVSMEQIVELCLASRALWTALYEADAWAAELLTRKHRLECERLFNATLQTCRTVRKVTQNLEIQRRLDAEIIPNIEWRNFIAGVLREDGAQVTRRLLRADTFRILSGDVDRFPAAWEDRASRLSLFGNRLYRLDGV